MSLCCSFVVGWNYVANSTLSMSYMEYILRYFFRYIHTIPQIVNVYTMKWMERVKSVVEGNHKLLEFNGW